VVVGVNRYPAAAEPLDVFRIDEAGEKSQARSVAQLRDTRDAAAVRAALDRLRADAARGGSVMPATIEAVSAYTTIGEIVGVLRDVHGSWTPSHAF